MMNRFGPALFRCGHMRIGEFPVIRKGLDRKNWNSLSENRINNRGEDLECIKQLWKGLNLDQDVLI